MKVNEIIALTQGDWSATVAKGKFFGLNQFYMSNIKKVEIILFFCQRIIYDHQGSILWIFLKSCVGYSKSGEELIVSVQ